MFIQIIVLLILILLNAFFAAAEIAFISLNDAKIELQAKEGNKKAKRIKNMLTEQIFSYYTNRNNFSRIFIKCFCIRSFC